MPWAKSALVTIPLILSGIFVVASPASAEQVGDATNWTSISTGGSHMCGLRSGKLYCWGNNDNGQVGNGGDDRQDVPDQIGSSDGWTAVSTGAAHTCGIRSAKLFCWGSDGDGQLGNGPSGSRDTPGQVSNANWKAVSAGGAHTCAIRSDSILACWGGDEHGQVGNGAAGSPSVPTLVSAAPWKSISAGGSHTCGVRTDGMIACWGDDSEGQIGNGAAGSPSVPTRISGGTWKTVSAGRAHTCAIRSDNLLACWGHNASGQVGNGGYSDVTVPLKITNATDWKVVSAGGAHTCATRGAIYCWGDDTFGQVTSIASATTRPSPVRRYSTVADFVTTDAGNRMSCGIRTNGKLYCWGGIDPIVNNCPVEAHARPSTIDLSYWKLTTPVDGSDSGSVADEVKYGGSPLDLATLDDPNYFDRLDSGAIRFRARAGGATTSGSDFPRSELREMTQDGEYDEAAWDRREGVHVMRIRQSINYTLVAKKHVVAGQIHDGSNDMLQIRLEGSKLLLTTKDGEPSGVLDDSYGLGTPFDLLVQADQCGIAVRYNDKAPLKVRFSDGESNDSWYFKAGVYTQSNPEEGDAATAYGEVTIFGLDVDHSS